VISYDAVRACRKDSSGLYGSEIPEDCWVKISDVLVRRSLPEEHSSWTKFDGTPYKEWYFEIDEFIGSVDVPYIALDQVEKQKRWDATDAVNAYTRAKMQEESVFSQLFPPKQVSR
jgi:hypothetical protein